MYRILAFQMHRNTEIVKTAKSTQNSCLKSLLMIGKNGRNLIVF